MALQENFGSRALGVPNRVAKSLEHTAKRLVCSVDLDKGAPINITDGKFVKGDATQANYGVIIDELNEGVTPHKAGEFATAITSGFIYVAVDGDVAIGDRMIYDLAKKLWTKDTGATAKVDKFICDEFLETGLAIMRILDTKGA